MIDRALNADHRQTEPVIEKMLTADITFFATALDNGESPNSFAGEGQETTSSNSAETKSPKEASIKASTAASIQSICEKRERSSSTRSIVTVIL